jgi:CHASE2 domain-containing sensor protein
LQPVEWATLDLFFRLRPLEPLDARIEIVTIGESDIKKVPYIFMYGVRRTLCPQGLISVP